MSLPLTFFCLIALEHFVFLFFVFSFQCSHVQLKGDTDSLVLQQLLSLQEEMQRLKTRQGLYAAGTRVKRGPDWKWGNQDGTPPGLFSFPNTAFIFRVFI